MSETVHKIKRSTLEDILEAARNTYPREFFCLLGGEQKKLLIDEFIVVPAIYGEEHTLFYPYLAPVDSRIIGSVHSHTSGSARPSRADLDVFARFGGIHLIIGYPFTIGNVSAYDRAGGGVALKVV